MSAERMPQADGSYLAQPFAAMTRLVLRFPVATVVIGVALALAAMLLTTTHLGYKTSRLDLLNPKSDYNRLWIEYIQEFGAEDDAVIVVEGASREVVVPVLHSRARISSFMRCCTRLICRRFAPKACTTCRPKSWPESNSSSPG